jgi:hypothetical protein
MREAPQMQPLATTLGHRRWRFGVWLGVICIAWHALACERKAPGPQECRRFAFETLGVRSTERLSERGHAELDDLTRRCLTTPFDRELLRCVEQTQRLNTCLREFQRRQAGEQLGPGKTL